MRTARTALVLLPALILVGCSGADDAPDAQATPYERPGWMAEQAQADEELIERQTSCMTEAGFVFDVAEDGQFSPSSGTDIQSFATALKQCTADALGDQHGWAPGPDELERLYGRQLDVAACLENEGYEVGSVPSKDSYVDSGGDWTPYDDLTLDGEAQTRLKKQCPDPGPQSL